MDRRRFLKGTMYFTVASAASTLAACGGSSSETAAQNAPAGSFLFPQGVASGDPKDTSAVFWTRCISSKDDGSEAALRLDVSTTSSFSALVASVDLNAAARYDHTVRAKITGLKPQTSYYYRFSSGQDHSPTGHTKTAAAPGTDLAQLRFAWMTCQDWTSNHWAAMELLANEEIDFLVHMGDYIYETVGASYQAGNAEAAHGPISFPNGASLPNGGTYADSVNDYRTLYKTYRSDKRLQELHRKFPMIAVWDDHEFSNDAWQDHQTYTNANLRQTSRRRNATQAWAEYMPIDFGDLSFDLNQSGHENIRIYRDFQFGSLMHLVMTDQRLYRDDHVVNESLFAQMIAHEPVHGIDEIGTRYFVPQPLLQGFEQRAMAQLQRAPGILGTTQTQWWKETMQASTAQWKVWGNEVTLNRMWLDMRQMAPAPYNQLYIVNADAWDGYPAHRADLLGHLKTQNIKNVIAITGDLHAFQCGVVRDTQDPATGTPVAVDFVAAGISSSSFYEYLKEGSAGTPLAPLVATPATYDQIIGMNNPDFAYLDHDAQGYAVATLTASAFTVLFNKVKRLEADGGVPAAPLAKRTRITVMAGTTTPLVEDQV